MRPTDSFAKTEWIPVISSALATGFLIVPLVLTVTRRFMDVCLIVMLTQALVGVLGFWFHMQANLVEPGHNLFDKLVNGAPPMAPLLFPNLVGLALIGMWALLPHLEEATRADPGWEQPTIGRTQEKNHLPAS